MNILFLTLSQIVSDINSRGIYPDLLRKFVASGHDLFIVCPFERRLKKDTSLSVHDNLHILGVRTLNITKSGFFEKGVGTILIDYQYLNAINKYLPDVRFDLVIYSTPPITFNTVVRAIKRKYDSKSYLLLKDIFPQNAVDLGILSKRYPLYLYFRRKEKVLYALSDHIGCMSNANVKFLLKQNPQISGSVVEVCPNSIDVHFEHVVADKASVFSKYGIPEDAKVFIYGGNLGKPQGIDFLIEVLKSNANRPDAFFLIAGSGTEYRNLDTFCKNEGLNNVLLLPALQKEEFDQLVRLSVAGLIFLDKRFTIPNYPSRLLTYLEYKKPVLAATDTSTDIGTIAEENGYGFWVKSGDLKAFNEKLDLMINNKSLLEEMGQKGYHYLLENYTVDTAYRIIMSHFN